MPVKEIKAHHAKDNNTCGMMTREMFQAHKDREELLKLVDEAKELINELRYIELGSMRSKTDDFLSKLD